MKARHVPAIRNTVGPRCAAHDRTMTLPISDERIIRRGGREWRLREMNAGAVPGALAARCLICESDDIVRRIWNYPDGWRDLSDDELLRLCERSSAA
jgi:hypothetical protein